MRRSALTTILLPIVVMSACTSPAGPSRAADPVVQAARQEMKLPAGWRWESFAGVQVGVPDEWGWGNGSQRLRQWCIATEAQNAEPIVGRPGAHTQAGCPDTTQPKPATLIKNTGTVVAFDHAAQPPGIRHEGDQTSVSLNDVLVTVNAPAELRRRIVETIRTVDADSFGCPSTHPVSADPSRRPAHPVPVTTLSDVSSVSVCKFALRRRPTDTKLRLVAGMRLDATAAEQTVRQIATAPIGGGPNRPDQCLPRVSYGDENIVLFVRSSSGTSEIVVRYAGCDHRGIDDGVSVRTLTTEVLTSLLTGPNRLPGNRIPLEIPSLLPSPAAKD